VRRRTKGGFAMAHVYINIPDSIKDQIKKAASKCDRSLSEQVLYILKDYLFTRPAAYRAEIPQTEFQVSFTKHELDFLRNILRGLNELLEQFYGEKTYPKIDGISPYWLEEKIFKQYHDGDGELCHKNLIGEVFAFKGKICKG
jgi:hypothetical protein